LLLLILSVGRYIPGIQKSFSLFSIRLPFRYPVKLLAAVIFPFSLLAAFGSRLPLIVGPRFSAPLTAEQRGKQGAMNRAPTNENKKENLLFWGISVLLVFLLGLLYFSPSIIAVIANNAFSQAPTAQMKRAWIDATLHAFIIWTAICFLRESAFRWKHAAIAAVLSLDLLVAGVPYKIFGTSELYTSHPQIVSVIKENIDSGKLFRTSGAEVLPLSFPDNDIFWRIAFQQQTLFGHLASNYGIPVIFHDDQDGSSLLSINYLRLVIGNLTWPGKLSLLTAANVRLILTPEHLVVRDLKLVGTIHDVSFQPFYLYINGKTPVSPRFVHRWLVALNPQEMLKKIVGPDFFNAGAIVLQTAVSPQVRSCAEPQILTKRQTYRSAIYEVKSECSGFLQFAEPDYPGWHVKVDGSEVQPTPANLLYFASFLEAGTHQVEKIYSPDTLKSGCLFSFVAIISLFALPLRFIKS
jgi:hypothetical protein